VKPRYAMVTTWNRRDMQQPLAFFERLEIRHLYLIALGDLAPGELEGAVHYGGPVDLYRKLTAARPHVVQGVEPLALRPLPHLLAIWLYAVTRRIPLVVVSAENRPPPVKYGRLVAALLHALLRPYVRSAALIVYLNEGTRRNLLACGAPPERMMKLMYGTWGVDTEEFSPEGAAHAEPGWDRYVLFVGRIERLKGVFDLLPAFRRIADRFPGVGLLMVGDGADRGAIEALAAELGLRERVRFTGMVLNRDLPPYLRGAALMASPSITVRGWEEQIGMTNIQAMACGTPVVSTRSGAIPEFVVEDETALLVDEGDQASLGEAMARLLGDAALAGAMGCAGRAFAVEQYDARRNVRRVEDVILARAGLG
jgi:glycosyltransferase involved in cell wall biosynthesis